MKSMSRFVCETCGVGGERETHELRRRKHHYCSRSCSTSGVNLRKTSHFPDLNSAVLEVVNGGLLGDSSISNKRTLRSNSSYVTVHMQANRDYVEWQKKVLVDYNPYIIDADQNCVMLGTCRCTAFTKLREKWYPNGKKIVPRDMKLTPLTVAVWFCDDGHNNQKDCTASFATNGFTQSDVEYLVTELHRLGIDCWCLVRKKSGQPIISVPHRSYMTLIQMIKPCVEAMASASMMYKVDTSGYFEPRERCRPMFDKVISGGMVEYRSFEEACLYAQSLGLKSNVDWVEFAKQGNKPADVPAAPANVYKQEWMGWGHFLGTGRRRWKKPAPVEWNDNMIETVKNMSLSSPEAAKCLNVTSSQVARKRHQLGLRREFFEFHAARELVRSRELNSIAEWREFIRDGKCPHYIPSAPDQHYKDEWRGWHDWMGYEKCRKQKEVA